jgi:hypothetical protein
MSNVGVHARNEGARSSCIAPGGRRLRVAIVGAIAAASLPAQYTRWVAQTSTTQPPYRLDHAMVYDAARQEVVLFGGRPSTGAPHGDTWVWNGSAWSLRVPPASPSARSRHGLAYDSVRQRVVLFGGATATGLASDTHEWDGATWSPRAPAVSPSARVNPGMAYDAARQRTVLFGGAATSAGTSLLDDTWEWNGATWTTFAVATRPLARQEAAMAFDPASSRIVLAAGRGVNLGDWRFDTWEWNGLAWTLTAPSTGVVAPGVCGPIPNCPVPPPLAIFWLPGTPFGPRIAGWGPTGAMLAYAGASWQTWPATIGAGVNLYMPKFAFDAARNQLLALAGDGITPNTALLTATPSSATVVGAGCGSPPLQLAPQPAAAPVVGATARATITNAPAAICVVAAGFNVLQAGPFNLPLALDPYGMPGCVLRHSADVDRLPTTAVGGGFEYALAIPNQLPLLGLVVRLQAYAFAPGVNAAQTIVSNRLDWRIGDV